MTNLKILVVEDDPILCDLLKLRLTNMGYIITGMHATGEDAIRAISEHVPDLIIMDITLIGELDGIETAQRIHKTNMIPIVFLTASTDTGTFERAKITEDSEYVIKPFTDNDLHIAIEMAYYKHGLSRKIHKKQKFFEDLLMQSRQGIIATDKEGFITLSNPIAEQVTGRHHFTTKKMQFSEMVIIKGPDGKVINDPLHIVRETLKVWEIPENAQLLDAEGKTVPVRGCISPVINTEQHFSGSLFCFHPLR